MVLARYFFFSGTFLPSRRASDRPMAIACFGFVTFFPLRPDFSLPCFMARISRSTSFPADGEYLRPEDFFDLLELDFFDAELRVLFLELLPRVLFFALLPRVLFLALLLREERPELFPRDELERDELPLELLADFFLAAFFVAITILLGGQMASSLEQVVSGSVHKVASQNACECFGRYTMRRTTGMRTSGSAMSHVVAHASVPVTRNLRIAGATNG